MDGNVEVANTFAKYYPYVKYVQDVESGAWYFNVHDHLFRLLPFRFIRRVGQGSSCDVALMRHESEEKNYKAAKVSWFQNGTRALRTRCFLNEVSILQELQHPHVVSMLYPLKSLTCSVILMDYYGHGSLHDYLPSLSDLLIHRYFIQVACALRYIHSKDIVHLDIKPCNVMVQDKKAYIVDFGLAHRLQTGTTAVTGRFGTRRFMAPEVVSADSTTVYDGFKADAYSLGATLWSMVLGIIPEEELNLYQTLCELEMDRTFKYCLRRLLRTNPEHRFDVAFLLKELLRRGYRKDVIEKL